MPGGASKMAGVENPPEAKLPPSNALRIAAIFLRTLFICIFVVLTLRVSMPQNETIWTAYDTPDDLIRLTLGLGVCTWLGFQLFNGPKDAHAYKTWLYLGLVAVPFTLICLFAVW
jgi:hypothetical protein